MRPNFTLNLKLRDDQTYGTATLCPLCEHNGTTCKYMDMACNAVLSLDDSCNGSIEESNMLFSD